MVRYYISLLGCGGGLPQHTASSMLATVRRPKALDRILDALALLQQLIDRIILAVFQRDTTWDAAVQPVGGRSLKPPARRAVRLLMMDRRAASLKAVASFPCQRIDVADGICDAFSPATMPIISISSS
jgi:hypothetical protein